MAGDLQTSAGGIHLGKPIIWPTGKGSGQPVGSPSTTESAGGIRTSVPTQTAPAAPTRAPAPTTPESAPAAPARPAPNVARPLTIEDIRAHLLQIQIPDSDFNVKLASLMLKDGMEVSRGNLLKLLSMLEGADKGLNTQEAAILLAMKGIDSPKALQILSQFFADNPQMAAQMAALQEGLAGLNSALGASQGLLNPQLLSQLTALISQFDESLRSLNDKYPEGLTSTVRGLKALLEGAQQQAAVADSAEASVLQAKLSQATSQLNSVINNLIAQGILSQKSREEVNYLYQQVPNAAAKAAGNVEIVVKREGSGQESTIDQDNTQVVLSLQTMNLGKMVCSIYVKGKRVYVIFVFNTKDYGDEAREIIAREFANLQKKLAEKDFVVSGYQVKVDPAMCAVRPYLIPLFPGLGAQLKKIDLEA
ncbi:hypothetical protein HZC35_04235 [Candidatus Saganbacteria bacterium]|nr:hypothetical protein [Candidatus Saganbacteria bacterium]